MMTDSDLPMFDYRLRPIDEVRPFGNPAESDPLKVHYFALTDGAFWIRVGDQELFRYSPEIINRWDSEAMAAGMTRDTFGEPYDDYCVIELAGMLREILGEVLEPIPADIVRVVDGTHHWCLTTESQPVTLDALRELQEKAGVPSDAAWDLVYRATGWWDQRRMSAYYLRYPPRLHFWSDGKKVEVRWDNRRHVVDGIPLWAAQVGTYGLSIEKFIREFQQFCERFFSDMRKRVRAVEEHWSRPEIEVDMRGFPIDQQGWEEIWDYARKPIPAKTDWDKVRGALQQLRANLD
jgi:hypothetical protein